MTETAQVTLAGFLLERFEEDEAAAREFCAVLLTRELQPGLEPFAFEKPGAPGDPVRALAEIGAKRRIVNEVYPALAKDNDALQYEFGASSAEPEDVLRLLALPYAGHADYREEWRP